MFTHNLFPIDEPCTYLIAWWEYYMVIGSVNCARSLLFHDTLEADFKPDVPLVVHWDGKLLRVGRLPVLVSGKNISKFLTIAKLPSGTGKAQAKAVHAVLAEWHITSKVCGMHFDTTSSNTGLISGACSLLQQLLSKDSLWFACCHHNMELLVGAAFEACFCSKRFKFLWGFIETDHLESGTDDESISMFFMTREIPSLSLQ